MIKTAHETLVDTESHCFGPARVVPPTEQNGAVRVRLEGRWEGRERWALPALPGARRFRTGERVLVIGSMDDSLYIIGTLESPSSRASMEERVVLKDGTRVTVTGTEGEESLQVRSGTDQLIFEYDTGTGSSRVGAPSGDLEFIARTGGIRFVAAQRIHFASEESVGMTGRHRVDLAIEDEAGRVSSSVGLTSGRLNLKGAEVGVTGRRGEIQLESTRFVGKDLAATVGRARMVFGRLETAANVVVDRAKAVYRTVEGLIQTRAGRVRTIVDSSYHLKADKAFLKADQDFKIKGEKIHLG